LTARKRKRLFFIVDPQIFLSPKIPVSTLKPVSPVLLPSQPSPPIHSFNRLSQIILQSLCHSIAGTNPLTLHLVLTEKKRSHNQCFVMYSMPNKDSRSNSSSIDLIVVLISTLGLSKRN